MLSSNLAFVPFSDHDWHCRLCGQQQRSWSEGKHPQSEILSVHSVSIRRKIAVLQHILAKSLTNMNIVGDDTHHHCCCSSRFLFSDHCSDNEFREFSSIFSKSVIQVFLSWFCWTVIILQVPDNFGSSGILILHISTIIIDF